jgi:hypothetical protein
MGFKRGVNQGGNGLRRGIRTEVEDDLALTGGTHTSARGKRIDCTGLGGALLGRGLLSLLGRKGFLGLFSYFLFFSSFSFSIFLFLL